MGVLGCFMLLRQKALEERGGLMPPFFYSFLCRNRTGGSGLRGYGTHYVMNRVYTHSGKKRFSRVLRTYSNGTTTLLSATEQAFGGQGKLRITEY
jgi:hypothetical protein